MNDSFKKLKDVCERLVDIQEDYPNHGPFDYVSDDLSERMTQVRDDLQFMKKPEVAKELGIDAWESAYDLMVMVEDGKTLVRLAMHAAGFLDAMESRGIN